MIKYFTTIYFMFSCSHALDTLPAPVNVTIESHNFHHILRWDPGIGTPPGTLYSVFKSYQGKSSMFPVQPPTNHTRFDLSWSLRSIFKVYYLHVQASHGNTTSPFGNTSRSFLPYSHTTIGPPSVALSGCGDCLQINISLPRAEHITPKESAQFRDAVSFDIYWKKAGEKKNEHVRTHQSEYELENLEVGEEYCVRVSPRLFDTHTLHSDWLCAFTTAVEPRGVAFLVGWSVGATVIGLCLFFPAVALVYTGFLCKLKTHLPRALTDLVQGSYLFPEWTVAEPVCVISECEPLGKRVQPGRQHARESSYQPAEEEDEDDEDEAGNCDYMDRAARLSSSGTGSSAQSQDAPSTVSQRDMPEHSGSVAEEVAPAVEHSGSCSLPLRVDGLGGHGEGQREGAGDTQEVLPHRAGPELQMKPAEEAREEREEEGGGGGGGHCVNVNLFSVTLGALEREREEEEEEEGDLRDYLSELQKEEFQLLLLSGATPGTTPRTTPGTTPRTTPGTHSQSSVLLPLEQTHRPLLTQTQTLNPPQTQTDNTPLQHLHRQRRFQSECSDRDSECGKAHSGYLVTHAGSMYAHADSTMEEEEEEEEECSGYMTR